MPGLDMRIHELFEAVSRGEVAPPEAASQLALLPYRELGFASLDTHREFRQGAPEAILAEGKTTGEVLEIASALLDAGAGSVMITRAGEDVRRAVLRTLPGFHEHERARAVWAINDPPQPRGLVVMLSAGTSDGAPLHEARIRAELIGTRVCVHEDVGVAGLHRLAPALDDLVQADCVVVVAGMDGALTSVVGGLVAAPVIGVPTSAGYGSAHDGHTALNAMLSSCAAGVAVVGIDDGLGAGTIAARIARTAAPA
ncbi:MAG TPA: nickel pincer cofactor biosynthesis protein LarB [Gaiellales bacterium]|jgi:NCAIR mutase (PurE)-related protein|nr:nickel pincer cofactor biosynthesis protein LarB [Gaiellales bacterium]